MATVERLQLIAVGESPGPHSALRNLFMGNKTYLWSIGRCISCGGLKQKKVRIDFLDRVMEVQGKPPTPPAHLTSSHDL
ncbi:hypothetical protein SAY86_027538 [Trapa natans]|uniref:Uncharacterized protein n=1 Tax=Trapa natans TaxID=22666 RepID=A0AAN7KRL2_TRANT|nr:hypothetical protein SAY86_027538 [Trapa natans]